MKKNLTTWELTYKIESIQKGIYIAVTRGLEISFGFCMIGLLWICFWDTPMGEAMIGLGLFTLLITVVYIIRGFFKLRSLQQELDQRSE